MKHEFLDHHSFGHSFFHHLHPGAKMIMVTIFIVCIVTIQPGQEMFLIPYTLILGAGLFLTQVPIKHSLGKGLKLLPFVIILTLFIPFLKEGRLIPLFRIGGISIAYTDEGMRLFFNIITKSSLAIFSAVFLNLTTPFHVLLKGIQSFGAPRIVTDTLALAYRYLFVITGEKERMLMAREARTINPARVIEWRSLSQLTGMLFIRSYCRGERLYQAMCSRGFDGIIRTLDKPKLLPKDWITVTLVASCAILIRITAEMY